MRNGWSWIGWGIVAAITSFPAWSAEPDPEEVRRRMEIYLREEKPAPVSKPAPVVDHDREAWQSAEKCGKPACFRAYLKKHPTGQYAEMAQAWLEEEPTPQPAVATPTARPTAQQRFTDNDDGTVTDNQTGLIWLKNANCFDRQNWSTAMDLAQGLSSGDCGLRDRSAAGQWRLPSKEEWKALIDKTAYNPALPAGHPFKGVRSADYWSSTADAGDASNAWSVYLIEAYVGTGGKSGTGYVWPVRGGR